MVNAIVNFIQFLCALVLHFDTDISDCVMTLVERVLGIAQITIWGWTLVPGSCFRFDEYGRSCADELHLESEQLVFKVYLIGFYMIHVIGCIGWCYLGLKE